MTTLQKELFKYKEWQILKWNEFEGSFINHMCCKYHPLEATLLRQDPTCLTCTKKIPNEVLGVWKLLNFNRIQNRCNWLYQRNKEE